MLKRLANLLQDRQLSLFDTEPPAPPPSDIPTNPRARREVLLGVHRVPYELKRARRRSIGFVVGAEGLTVSAPRWVTVVDIENALLSKGDWILRKLVEQRERAQRLEAARIRWEDGAVLPYLGMDLTIQLDAGRSGIELLDGQILCVGLPPSATEDQLRETIQAWLQRRARAVFEPRCAHFAALLGVEMKHMRLTSAQTRWGSASADGTIRLNWRLVHYAPSIIDYVVAHELAHLREMNHSPAFWAVVRSVLPDFEDARGRLKQESLAH
ncbi:MAG: M48 family metallopeptidase [Paucibacter sp.]|nr:M48 family metallopeptidase [Roseateles sp.]